MNRTRLLQNPLPVDRVAARVVFKKGEHWTPRMKPAEHMAHAPVPLPVRAFPAAVQPNIRAIVGKRRGRMVVLGLAGDLDARAGNAAWVVRCDCGNYEHRSRIQRWLSNPADDACRECRARHFVRTGRSFGVNPELADGDDWTPAQKDAYRLYGVRP